MTTQKAETATAADRARGALLGLALGDAYGRPLEFLLLPEVRTATVDLRVGSFRWTDDTHMSIFLAQAIEDLPGHEALDQDALGRAVGQRFAEWAEDPLTPSTAPGGTCLRGARAFARHGDWQRSGDRGSDGCGAVMRIAPVALAFSDQELVHAARISAIVTHAHPNAVEAAIAGAWLCRQAVIEGRFDAGMVAQAITHLHRDWSWGGKVDEALEAALELAEADGDWLDEEAIPPGDGGWRSASALGLAVATVLRWSADGVTVVIDKAARIEGDSDSVAALAGIFYGAAHGVDALPRDWILALPRHAELDETAARLWARGLRVQPAAGSPAAGSPAAGSPAAGSPAAGLGQAVQLSLAPAVPARAPSAPHRSSARSPASDADGHAVAYGQPQPAPLTSLDQPLLVRWLDLSVADARAPRGRIGLCAAPGRQDQDRWRRQLGVDLDRLVSLHKVDHLLILIDEAERAALGLDSLVSEAEARDIVVAELNVTPGSPPPAPAWRVEVQRLLSIARAGRRVVIVSRHGQERGGTVAAAALVALGLSPEAALRSAREVVGPRAASSDEQRAFVQGLNQEAQS